MKARTVVPFLVAYAAVAVTLATVAGAVKVHDLLDDPLVLGGAATEFPWKGSLSQIGGMAMTAGGSVALAVALARRQSDRAGANFFLGFGAIALAFAADDLLVVHDYLMPDLLGADAKAVELVLFSIYGLVAVAWLGACRREVRRHDPEVLLLIAALFGLSAGIDVILGPTKGSVPAAVEDVAKLLAAGTVAAYSFRSAQRVLRGPENVDARG